MRVRDVLDFVDHLYRPSSSIEEWGDAVAEVAAPFFDDGLGVVVRLDTLDPADILSLRIRSSDPRRVQLIEAANEQTRHAGPMMLKSGAASQGPRLLCQTPVSEQIHQKFTPEFDEAMGTSSFGATDWIQLAAADGTGFMALIAAPVSGAGKNRVATRFGRWSVPIWPPHFGCSDRRSISYQGPKTPRLSTA